MTEDFSVSGPNKEKHLKTAGERAYEQKHTHVYRKRKLNTPVGSCPQIIYTERYIEARS